ncbi:MAG: hypothetical protein PVS3B3_26240 [Ktedonobacteraceae bacterium]
MRATWINEAGTELYPCENKIMTDGNVDQVREHNAALNDTWWCDRLACTVPA